MIYPSKLKTLSLLSTVCLAASLAGEPAPVTQPANSYTKQQIVNIVSEIAADSPYMPQDLSKRLEAVSQSTTGEAFEENIEKIIDTLLAIKIKPEQRTQLEQFKAMIEKKFQGFKASGPAFAADLNGAFFVDTQDPRFTVTYQDAAGNTKTRTYQADISLVGLNIELALRLNLIFFVGTDFNFHETSKVIELGRGIQLSPFSILSPLSDKLSPISRILPIMRLVQMNEAHQMGIDPNTCVLILEVLLALIGHKNFATSQFIEGNIDAINWLMYALSHLNLTYIPFKNIQGGMIIVGAVFGADNINLSMVTGGTLTPVTNLA